MEGKSKYHFAGFLSIGGPIQVFSAEDFLYPQYDDKFEEFKQDAKAWLQEQARIKLMTECGTPELKARWESIANGSFFKNEG